MPFELFYVGVKITVVLVVNSLINFVFKTNALYLLKWYKVPKIQDKGTIKYTT